MGKQVKEVTEDLVLPILAERGLELVDIEYVKEGGNWFLRVFIDKESGVDLDDCTSVSEALSKRLDEVDPIGPAYFLEVSSPGVERPLKNDQDFQRALGKTIWVKAYRSVDGRKEWTGELHAFDGTTLTLHIHEKSGVQPVHIPYTIVAQARLALIV